MARVWDWLAEAPVRYVPVIGLVLVLSALLVMRGGSASDAQNSAHAPAPATTGVTSTPGPSTATTPTAAGDASSPAPATGTTATTTAGASAEASSDPLADLTAPLTYPQVVAQALADLRAEAFSTLDLDIVRQLNAPGSPALAADSAAVARATGDGLRYTGLEFVVRSAAAHPAPHARQERVVLDAEMAASAFTITAPDGSVTRTPPRPVTTVRLELVWSGGRWQIAEAA